MQTIIFCYQKYSPIFLFLNWQYLGPLLHFFWPFRDYLFGPSGLFVGSGYDSKIFLGPNYLDSSNLFVFDSAKFGALFCNIWVFRGYFQGWSQVQKPYLRPSCIDNELWFWKYSNILYFQFDHIWGLLCTFLGPSGLLFGPLGLFLWSGSGSRPFLEHL